jgi:hypothetical protein
MSKVLGHVTVLVDFEDWVEDEDTRQRVKRLRRDVGNSNGGPLGGRVHGVVNEELLPSLQRAIVESGVDIELISYGLSIAKAPKRPSVTAE